eukprot:TRINITY_DN2207_c0_g1_i1.p1 TRINITY_DN2207_c0_g1~~TRINITY_DN2207_c0_g1_i1.p1  ORF type:complete len:159 (+),score=20.21 TRINITY_DN2207_c0_g1_i1:53-529(+)
MLPRRKSIFDIGDEGQEYIRRSTIGDLKSLSPSSAVPVGLRILIVCSQRESNVVVKPVLKPSRPVARTHGSPKIFQESSFLKACCLCKKQLCPKKDVYMYRGDQGFCSVECRGHQILLDERQELEAATREMVAPPSHCGNGGRRIRESTRRRGIPAAA